MTETDFTPYVGPPGPGIARWPAGVPLPAPWFGSEPTAQLICDLCDAWSDELWPLSTYPPSVIDEENAGDMFICRDCANGVRPPIRRLLPAHAARAEV